MKEEVFPVWVVYALLAAVFAALTSILAKLGLDNVNANLATAIRTVVVLVMAWGIVFMTGKQHEITKIGQKSWLFLILSGCATGISWLFFYKALQMGEASKIISIDKLSVIISLVMAFTILGEKMGVKSLIGGLLITAGAIVMAF